MEKKARMKIKGSREEVKEKTQADEAEGRMEIG